MKSFLLCVFMVSFAFQSYGCKKFIGAFVPMVHGSGNVIKQSRTVSPFTGIEIDVNADVHVSQIADQSVQFEGEDNILEMLHAEVKHGILTISSDHDFSATKPLTIYIASPNIESVELDGSGTIKGETPLHAPDFKTEIAGSGSMDLNVTADKLESSLEGSGEYFLHGKADKFTGDISGSGTYHAFDLETAEATVTINGSGNAEVLAKETLNAEVNGSGDIDYKGEPGKVHTSMNGSGSVTKK